MLRVVKEGVTAEAVMPVLEQFGCPQEVAIRVTTELLDKDWRWTSLANQVDVDALKVALAPVGVAVSSR